MIISFESGFKCERDNFSFILIFIIKFQDTVKYFSGSTPETTIKENVLSHLLD